ncbi:MAG: nucleotide exchange factor GrpE [Spirochaetales bacterium]|nr:nucleotide exchange factor GrpE [Spirochaetales bacterium]
MSIDEIPLEDSIAVEEGAEMHQIDENVEVEKEGKSSRKKKKNDKNKEMEDKIVELEESNADLKDQLLRKQADFDNFRKRMFREKEEAIKYANSNLLQDIVGTIDDFERALQSADQSNDFKSLHSGVELIEKQLTSMLERKYGLKRFESVGEEFNPDRHEALAMEESEDYDVQTVIEDYLKGFMLHERVLRHSKVKVASPAKNPENIKDASEEPEA